MGGPSTDLRISASICGYPSETWNHGYTRINADWRRHPRLTRRFALQGESRSNGGRGSAEPGAGLGTAHREVRPPNERATSSRWPTRPARPKGAGHDGSRIRVIRVIRGGISDPSRFRREAGAMATKRHESAQKSGSFSWVFGFFRKVSSSADELELRFMEGVEAELEEFEVAQAKSCGEQAADLAIDAFDLPAG